MKYLKKLIKKLIVVSGIAGLRLTDFVLKVGGFATAATANPTIAPDLDPTPVALKLSVDALEKKIEDRVELEKQVKAKTVAINNAVEEITTDINDGWCLQIQEAVNGDVEKVKLLGFSIKGEGTGGVSTEIVGRASSSNAIISSIDSNAHMEHTIHVINSANGSVGVPPDAKSINIYMQVGGTVPPNDIDKMTYLGTIKRGKFVKEFTQDDIGKTVYYIVVYISRKTEKPMRYSPVVSATVN